MTMTYGQIEDALQAAIRATLPDDDDDCWFYVCDFSETFVVYYQNGEYFQDDYSIDDEGNVTLAGSPVAVKPVTTYIGLGRGGEQTIRAMLEQRGLRVARTPPPQSTQRSAPRVQVVSEPLTYRRDSVDERGNGVSYLRDLYMRHRDQSALDRLTRHAVEITDYRKRAAERTLRAFERGVEEQGIEYRTNPNPTQGTGGYFNPPAWLIEDAATYPRPKRVLANLVNNFPLPPGASSVNIPVMLTGNTANNQDPGTANDSSDVTDASTSCNAITISSIADVAIQFLEMGPVSGATDQAWFRDLSEAYDYNLETQLITGTGGTFPGAQFTGLVNVSSINGITYTDASPTGHAMFPFFGEAAASIGKKRGMPPFAWLMRTARWAWLVTSEDTSDRPLEFPELMGADNPLCPGAIAGWPVWMEDAIPTTLGAGGNQDTVIACIPSDIYLFEGQAVSHINVETLSGTLQARFTYRNYAAAITGRYSSGISVLSGTGMIPVSGY